MLNSTSITYQMKREILSFSRKFSNRLPKPEKKFSADMTYGILAARSRLLTDIVDQFHEDSKKVNSVERLTRHMNKGVPLPALKSYLIALRRRVPALRERRVYHIWAAKTKTIFLRRSSCVQILP